MTNKDKMYRVIIHHCDSKGEDFWFCWENTPTTQGGMERLHHVMFDPGDEGDKYDPEEYEFLEDLVPISELIVLNKWDSNTYMSRINIVGKTDWNRLADLTLAGEDPLYKGEQLRYRSIKE